MASSGFEEKKSDNSAGFSRSIIQFIEADLPKMIEAGEALRRQLDKQHIDYMTKSPEFLEFMNKNLLEIQRYLEILESHQANLIKMKMNSSDKDPLMEELDEGIRYFKRLQDYCRDKTGVKEEKKSEPDPSDPILHSVSEFIKIDLPKMIKSGEKLRKLDHTEQTLDRMEGNLIKINFYLNVLIEKKPN